MLSLVASLTNVPIGNTPLGQSGPTIHEPLRPAKDAAIHTSIHGDSKSLPNNRTAKVRTFFRTRGFFSPANGMFYDYLTIGLVLQLVFAETATGIVQDVVLDDRGGSSQVDDAEGQVVEGDKTGCTSLLHLLTNQGEVGLFIKFVGTYEHRVTTGGLLTLGVDILACEGLQETIGVDATHFLTMMDEGEAVGIVQIDEHILTVTALQIAEGGVFAK